MRLLVATAFFVVFNIQFSQAVSLPKASLPKFTGALNFAEEGNFEGTVALSNCSGSIIRFDQSDENDLALMMTNGHCIRLMGADEVVIDQKVTRSMTVLDAKAKNLGRLRTARVVYATMKKTDLAIYELEKTYKEIRDRFNVEPLTLSASPARIGDEIRVISGYWKASLFCKADDFVFRLKEADWTFEDSLRYSPECKVYGGTSGSPVVLEGTRTVIAVNNTGNEDGKECLLNNPCEVTKDQQVSVRKGIGYGQQVYWIYSWLNENRKLDLSIQGCLLPKP